MLIRRETQARSGENAELGWRTGSFQSWLENMCQQGLHEGPAIGIGTYIWTKAKFEKGQKVQR